MTIRNLSRVSHVLQRKGQLNLPGITAGSQQAVTQLLATDGEKHHCYFRSAGLHNHLSHHLLAAYDLGAPAAHLKKIYEYEASTQRPIFVEEKDSSIVVTDDNWAQYLGNQSAYGAFVEFFSSKISDHGTIPTLEKYVFEEEANKEGKSMLIRLVSGAIHPFIQIGYGLEFENDMLVATGLAQTAIHSPTGPNLFDFDFAPSTDGSAAISEGISVLEVLRKVYDSDVLRPKLPYEPDALFSARLAHVCRSESAEEIKSICSQFRFNVSPAKKHEDEFWAKKADEFVWASTLLMSATGKEGRKPRLDFFLMHLVTSSLFLRPFLSSLHSPVHKSNLLRAYLPVVILITLARGRPRIDPSLLMSYNDTPRPPVQLSSHLKTILSQPQKDEEYNPWPAMIGDVIYHPESHVLKTMRTLIFAARMYGHTSPGSAPGAFKATSTRNSDSEPETHKGTAGMDGTIFVRAAGMLMDYMGWVGHGQEAREDWDRSALGWDAAWDNEDE